MEREIKMSFVSSLEEIINMLLEKKAKGEHVYCRYFEHIIHSDDVLPGKEYLDKIYLELEGITKTDLDILQAKDLTKNEKYQCMKEREKEYAKLVSYYRKRKYRPDRPFVTKKAVIAGLKFIAENPDIQQLPLVNHLLALNCYFTPEDIRIEGKHNRRENNLDDGIKNGDIYWGAHIIANMRDYEVAREEYANRFLKDDSELSIYHFIRQVTGDETYTKESIKNKCKRRCKKQS